MGNEAQPTTTMTPEVPATPPAANPPADAKTAAPATPAKETPAAAAPAAEAKPATPAANGDTLLTKSSGEAPAAAGAEKAAAPAVPDKYELTLPKDSAMPKEYVAKVEAFAKEKGLTNEQAQAILDRDNQMVVDQKAHIAKQSADWKSELEADPHIGGENFQKNAEVAHQFIKRFGDDKLFKELDESGLGNHPGLFRLALKAGLAMQDDSFVRSSAPQKAETSVADKLYGKTQGAQQ